MITLWILPVNQVHNPCNSSIIVKCGFKLVGGGIAGSVGVKPLAPVFGSSWNTTHSPTHDGIGGGGIIPRLVWA